MRELWQCQCWRPARGLPWRLWVGVLGGCRSFGNREAAWHTAVLVSVKKACVCDNQYPNCDVIRQYGMIGLYAGNKRKPSTAGGMRGVASGDAPIGEAEKMLQVLQQILPVFQHGMLETGGFTAWSFHVAYMQLWISLCAKVR